MKKMTADEIQEATLDLLRAARKEMMSTRWILKLKTATDQEKLDHANTLVTIHHVIQELENKELSEIREELVKNEKAISKGIDELKDSLKKIEKIGKAIKAIGQFLQLVGKVAKLVATA